MRAKQQQTAEIWVPLAHVHFRARSLSAATVERYRQWLEQGLEAPAVRLVRQGEEFVVRDGRHRVAAALAAGHLDIKAVVRRIARPVMVVASLCRRCLTAAGGPGSPVRGAAACVSAIAPVGFGRLLTRKTPEQREDEGSNPSGSIGVVSTPSASVVSTASTRPLYGRGAGSTPAGGSFERP